MPSSWIGLFKRNTMENFNEFSLIKATYWYKTSYAARLYERSLSWYNRIKSKLCNIFESTCVDFFLNFGCSQLATRIPENTPLPLCRFNILMEIPVYWLIFHGVWVSEFSGFSAPAWWKCTQPPPSNPFRAQYLLTTQLKIMETQCLFQKLYLDDFKN